MWSLSRWCSSCWPPWLGSSLAPSSLPWGLSSTRRSRSRLAAWSQFHLLCIDLDFSFGNPTNQTQTFWNHLKMHKTGGWRIVLAVGRHPGRPPPPQHRRHLLAGQVLCLCNTQPHCLFLTNSIQTPSSSASCSSAASSALDFDTKSFFVNNCFSYCRFKCDHTIVMICVGLKLSNK